jgi:serine/threonine-protein kinase
LSVPVGTRLGPFEIVSSLGAGGMGEVYRARDTRLGRHVAVKVLAPGVAAEAQFRERFEREARTASSLSHPAICALFDVGEQDGHPFLVMECLEGETLAARLRRGPLAVETTLHIAIQLADGLAHAHAAGIVHRDFKPGNVMVLENDFVKILDFGLARRFASEASEATVAGLSESGLVIGTVAYMSPEQTLGERFDHRSDVFSLGVTIYEMVAGARPFDGHNVFSVMKKIVEYDPPSPSLIRPLTPRPLEDLLTGMLAKNPRERPQTMREVASALRSIAGVSSPTGTLPLRPAGAAGSRARRSPAVVGVVAASLLALIAVVAVPSWRGAIWRRFGTPGAPSPDSSSAAATPALPRTAAEWVAQGRAYMQRYDRRGNVDRAHDAYQRAIELDRSHAAAHAGLAEVFLRRDLLTPDVQWMRQANEAARQALALNPDLAAAHAVQGLLLLRSKLRDAAKAAIDRALDLDPLNLTALIALGDYHLGGNDRAAADGVYRRAAKLLPDQWRPLTMLGQSLYAQAKYAEALEAWQAALALTPDNVLVLRNLGGAFHMLDRIDEAANMFQRALEIEPTAGIYTNIGTLRFFQGRYSDAVAAFEKAVEINPTYSLYWGNLGDGYRWVPGREADARAAYSRAIALIDEQLRTRGDASNAARPTLLATYLSKAGDRARAARELQQWADGPDSAKNAADYFRALVSHEVLGNRDAALAALEQALAAGYALKEIQNEPELTKLRSDPRYHRILARR